jgi:uncharacterized membrane protein
MKTAVDFVRAAAENAKILVPKKPQTPGEQAANAGTVVIFVGAGIAAIPGIGLVLFLVGVPMLIASFVLSIVAMARGSTSSGICLMIATFLAPVLWALIGAVSTAFFAS